MKVVRFLKRVGIAAIPILAVVILMLCFNIASMLSFNTHYPDKLSQNCLQLIRYLCIGFLRA